MNKIITSRTNTEIKALLDLKNSNSLYFLLEGEHLITLALEANCVIKLYGTKEYPNFSTTLISSEVAAKLSQKKSPASYFAKVKKPELTLDTTKPLLFLDNVQDPGNVGTLMRSAYAFGFGGVIGGLGSASFYNDKTISAAQGVTFFLPHITSDSSFLTKKKSEGYTILGTNLTTKAISPKDIDKTKKHIIVLGNEGSGISEEISSLLDQNVIIPINHVDSLNVAIAGSILMYEISHK